MAPTTFEFVVLIATWLVWIDVAAIVLVEALPSFFDVLGHSRISSMPFEPEVTLVEQGRSWSALTNR